MFWNYLFFVLFLFREFPLAILLGWVCWWPNFLVFIHLKMSWFHSWVTFLLVYDSKLIVIFSFFFFFFSVLENHNTSFWPPWFLITNLWSKLFLSHYFQEFFSLCLVFRSFTIICEMTLYNNPMGLSSLEFA